MVGSKLTMACCFSHQTATTEDIKLWDVLGYLKGSVHEPHLSVDASR